MGKLKALAQEVVKMKTKMSPSPLKGGPSRCLILQAARLIALNFEG